MFGALEGFFETVIVVTSLYENQKIKTIEKIEKTRMNRYYFQLMLKNLDYSSSSSSSSPFSKSRGFKVILFKSPLFAPFDFLGSLFTKS